MKKTIKIIKIFFVLLTIFSQLLPTASVLAAEIVNNNDNIEENNQILGIDGYLKYEEEDTVKFLNGTVNDDYTQYNVEDKIYTQMLIVSGDLIDDEKEYSVKVNDNDTNIITGSELKAGIEGTVTDFTNVFNTNFKYTDTVVISEVGEEESIETYTLTYNSVLTYEKEGNSADSVLNDLFNNTYVFNNNNFVVNAKGLSIEPVVPSVKSLYDKIQEIDGIELNIYNKDGVLVEIDDDSEDELLIKNGYVLNFIKGISSVNYITIVMGDATDDSIFNSDDMLPTMKAYINEEIMPTMDLYLTEHETDVPGEFENDPLGTITFEDVMLFNKYLNNNQSQSNDVKLKLISFNDKLYVGDTFKVDVVIDGNDKEAFINGITGVISNSDNLKLANIYFNDKFIGTYNEENELVGAGYNVYGDETVLTMEFMAVNDGEGTISFNGKTANDLTINEFEELSLDVDIIRKNSNNNLASLNANVGNFDIRFDKDVTKYTLTVPYDTESVILYGSLEDVTANVSGLVKYTLNEDVTIATITVTAEDGSTKVYTVNIVKESKPVVAKPVVYYYSYSSNNYLKSLEIDNYTIDFDKEINEYVIDVESKVKSLDIKALPDDNKARVEITGNEGFKKGENTVIITVTAEDGSTREYKIIVNKAGEKSSVPTEIDDSSNTAEKVVIIILIILVVLGLLYLIFKKDDEDEFINIEKEEIKKPEIKKNTNSKNDNKNKKER